MATRIPSNRHERRREIAIAKKGAGKKRAKANDQAQKQKK